MHMSAIVYSSPQIHAYGGTSPCVGSLEPFRAARSGREETVPPLLTGKQQAPEDREVKAEPKRRFRKKAFQNPFCLTLPARCLSSTSRIRFVSIEKLHATPCANMHVRRCAVLCCAVLCCAAFPTSNGWTEPAPSRSGFGRAPRLVIRTAPPPAGGGAHGGEGRGVSD